MMLPISCFLAIQFLHNYYKLKEQNGVNWCPKQLTAQEVTRCPDAKPLGVSLAHSLSNHSMSSIEFSFLQANLVCDIVIAQRGKARSITTTTYVYQELQIYIKS